MKYKKKVLKNGVRVLFVLMVGSPTVTYMVYVNAGSHHEEKRENGISHFLEHMSFKGTINRTIKEIRKDVDGVGAYNNAFTWNEYTAYYAKTHPRNLKKIISVISDMYLNSTIPEKELKIERGVILGEIDMYEDNPKDLVSDVWRKSTYGNQPAGRGVLGPKKNIKNFKREDFLNYKKKHYVASSTVVVVAGNFNEKLALKEIDKQFKDISVEKKPKKVKVKSSQGKQKLVIRNKKTDQTHLILGFKSLNLFDSAKDIASLSILNTVLGRSMSSRLWVRIREELGLGYYISSSFNLLTDYGHLQIAGGIDNNRLVEALEAILQEVNKLKKEIVPKEELERAKKYFLGTFPMALEQSNNVAIYYGNAETLGKDPVNPQGVYKKIKKVTAKDVQGIAKKIFRNNKMNLAIVGPHKDKKKFSKIFKL
jgi:predicted Zn-dependent peptidase